MALRIVAVTALFALASARQTFLAKQSGNEHIGSYEDKNHMIGKHGAPRAVVINGNEGKIIGKDEEGADPWEVKLTIEKHSAGAGHTGDELIVDFSPKGGPKDMKATVTANGISFPDGNVWVKTDIPGVDNQKCKNLCIGVVRLAHQFSMEALGAHFDNEEITDPTACAKQCNVVYPQC